MYRASSENKPLIVAHFTDGYSFRNVLGFFRQTCTRANIVFTPKEIIIKEVDASDTILADCIIEADDLSEYKYNAKDENGETLDAVACGFMTLDMQKATKMVGKKDAIRLYTREEKHAKLYIQVVHASSKSDNNVGLRIVPLIDVPFEPFDDIRYKRSSPNARAASTEFAKICADFSSQKCTLTTAIGYPEGIVFKGFESDIMKCLESYGTVPKMDKLISTDQYGLFPQVVDTPKPKLDITDPDEVYRVEISAKIIRAMTKFNNLSPTGVIKFFVEKEMPLKIVSPIGCYGKLVLYIKNVEDS